MAAKNSIMSDPAPFLPPKEQPKLKAPKKTEWEKLATSNKYKEIVKYIKVRQEYHRHFLPGGEELAKLIITDKDAALMQVGISSGIIKELDDFLTKTKLEVR